MNTQIISKMWELPSLEGGDVFYTPLWNAFLLLLSVSCWLCGLEDAGFLICGTELQLRPLNMHKKPILGFLLLDSICTSYKEIYTSFFLCISTNVAMSELWSGGSLKVRVPPYTRFVEGGPHPTEFSVWVAAVAGTVSMRWPTRLSSYSRSVEG